MGSRPASRMEKHSVSVRIKWSSRWMFTSPSARAMLPVASISSMEDMEATGSIARALGLVNIHLLDHFILTDTECFSMRDAGRLPIYDFKTGTLFWP